jgi:hypothetical protein
VHCTLDYMCADYPGDRNLRMSSDEFGKWHDLAQSARTKSKVQTKITNPLCLLVSSLCIIHTINELQFNFLFVA